VTIIYEMLERSALSDRHPTGWWFFPLIHNNMQVLIIH